nr:unnamed protein product [Callosobruchus analis]
MKTIGGNKLICVIWLLTQLDKRKKHIYFMFIKIVAEMNIYNNNRSILPGSFNDPNAINKYFIQSVEATGTTVNNDTLKYYSTYRIAGNPNSFYFSHINEKNVLDAISSIISNAMGTDGFNLQMVMQLFHIQLIFLTTV